MILGFSSRSANPFNIVIEYIVFRNFFDHSRLQIVTRWCLWMKDFFLLAMTSKGITRFNWTFGNQECLYKILCQSICKISSRCHLNCITKDHLGTMNILTKFHGKQRWTDWQTLPSLKIWHWRFWQIIALRWPHRNISLLFPLCVRLLYYMNHHFQFSDEFQHSMRYGQH